jgi:hypothetical protein
MWQEASWRSQRLINHNRRRKNDLGQKPPAISTSCDKIHDVSALAAADLGSVYGISGFRKLSRKPGVHVAWKTVHSSVFRFERNERF